MCAIFFRLDANPFERLQFKQIRNGLRSVFQFSGDRGDYVVSIIMAVVEVDTIKLGSNAVNKSLKAWLIEWQPA